MGALGDIAITGLGVVSTLGHDPKTLLDNLIAGESAVSSIDAFDTAAFPCTVGARVTDFKARDWVANRKNLRLMTDAVRFGLAAIKRAYADAGLSPESTNPERFGLFVGAGTAFGETQDLVPSIEASITDGEFDSTKFGTEGMHLISPLWLLKGLSNNVLGFASADLDARGINQNYCNSGVGGLQAIGEAAWALAEGKADILIAGGADSSINPAHFTGFGRLGMLTSNTGPDACRPFDARHDGFAPGEGAAFVALERLSDAMARGRTPLARLVGYGDACAAHAMPKGDVTVIQAAALRALQVAGWAPTDVDLIYAHGSGTRLFDRQEATALAAVFGEHAPPVTSNKGQLGHAIAGSGPISLICAIEVLRRGVIPAIAHTERIDPGCSGSNIVVKNPRRGPFRRALIHAAGLGGQTTFLAVEID